MRSLFAFMVGISCLCACQSPELDGPYAAEGAFQDSLRAQSLTQEAVQVADGEPDRAEKLLRQALSADIFHGPAHNNLGVLFFRQGIWYDAAIEFEWARKLLPGDPAPRLNLALTLERAGHIDEAIATFEAALQVAPEHIPSLQALVRTYLRNGKNSPDLARQLKTIALRGETQEWREWAGDQLARQ